MVYIRFWGNFLTVLLVKICYIPICILPFSFQPWCYTESDRHDEVAMPGTVSSSSYRLEKCVQHRGGKWGQRLQLSYGVVTNFMLVICYSHLMWISKQMLEWCWAFDSMYLQGYNPYVYLFWGKYIYTRANIQFETGVARNRWHTYTIEEIFTMYTMRKKMYALYV